jgi:LL-diaminopimelate aminotransferase
LFERSDRLKKVPPYLFAEIGRKIAKAKAEGRDVISLGIGDPDIPTPDHIVDEMCRAIRDEGDPARHRYGGDNPVKEFPKAVASYYKRRFGVELDQEREVLPLIGSKEGIAHIPLAFVNPGDIVLAPNPGYPVYNVGTIFAGGTTFFMPLLEKNGYLPDFSGIPKYVASQAKIMWLNYPNNPTTATATLEFFEEAVDFARRNKILICHDAAYVELTYDGYEAPSILQVHGAKDVAVEIGSLSKPYNMTGWRIGFAVGNAEAISALALVKENMDSGILRAIQFAGVKALRGPQDCVLRMREIYRARRDLVVDGLNKLGWKLDRPKATFYIWAPVPKGYTSMDFATMLLEKADVVVTPGVGYGEYGEGYFRISLTYPDHVLEEAMRRISNALG